MIPKFLFISRACFRYGGSDCNTVYCMNNCSNSAPKPNDPPNKFDRREPHLDITPTLQLFITTTPFPCLSHHACRGECRVKRTPSLEDPDKEDIEATCICSPTTTITITTDVVL